MALDTMLQFERPPEGFEPRSPQLTVNGKTLEAKLPPSILDVLQGLDQSQAARCVTCGSAGCFQGGGEEKQGCPFGRPIPDIHQAEVLAAGVLKQAYDLLNALKPDKVKELHAAANDLDNPDLPAVRTRLPIMVFKALDQAGLHQQAAELQQNFDFHMKHAFDISEQAGPMGDIYGRICPSSLCENACITSTLNSGHGAITIRANEAIAWDYAWERGWLTPIEQEQKRDENIVIIGSGFAGYAAAESLHRKGYSVSIIERNAAPGEPGHGQILPYKALQERFNRHYERLEKSGVKIVTNRTVGAEGTSLSDLTQEFKARAVIFATGTPKAKEARLEGDASEAVLTWQDHTKAQQYIERMGLSNDSLQPQNNAKDKVVGIIGTGDTAVDNVRTAALQGAREIIMISRHNQLRYADEDAWAGMKKELKAKGIKFRVQEWMAPHSIQKNGEGFTLIGYNKEKGQSGDIKLELDMVISAIGNETGDLAQTFGIEGLPTQKEGRLKGAFKPNPAPEDIATNTNIFGVGAGYLGEFNGVSYYAAGQCVRGDSLAAICGRDGLDVAEMVYQQLNAENI